MALTQVKADGLTADLIDETKLADNSIDSEHYNDGSIDNAHLADDAVGVDELSATGTAGNTTYLRGDNSWTVPPDTNTTYSVQDGQLSENNFTDADHTKLNGIAASANNYVHPNHSGDVTSSADGATTIADNAVTLAHMAGGTDGQIITYDASGDPKAIGPGLDGQVLTSAGAGAEPAFEAIPASGTPNNLIYNGAMQVAQRGTSLAMAHDGNTNGFVVDGWALQMHNMDEFDGTLAQVADGPAGFTKALKWTTGTAESAIATDEYVMVRHHIESQNLQHLNWGTSDAQAVMLSFWVKSSVTGTYGCSFYSPRSSGNRVINTTYAISSADTWEKKTITIAGDTAGSVLNNDADAGLSIIFPLAAGSNYDGTNSSSWANYSTANYLGAHAQDGVVTTGSATWLITGIQLETGSTAGSFDYKSYTEELAICQRYYQQIEGSNDNVLIGAGRSSGTTYGLFSVPLAVPLRASPTLSSIDWSFFTATNQTGVTATPSIIKWAAHSSVLSLQVAGLSSMTNARCLSAYSNNADTFTMSSEI